MKNSVLQFLLIPFLVCVLSAGLFPQSPQTQKEKNQQSSSGANNNFYDDAKTYALEGPEVTVVGEIKNPGIVDWSTLKKRSVIVREVSFKDNRDKEFVGAYRYDGYSLFDILKERYVHKKNQNEFPPPVDLLITIENNEGEKAVLSWGEVYYPACLHRVLIAVDAAPILPTKTDEEWPIPEKTKLICANDVLTVRNIDQPSKITVMTHPFNEESVNGDTTLYSEKMNIYENEKKIDTIKSIDNADAGRTYPSVFYGRGRGFHGFQNFKGKLFEFLLSGYFKVNEENLKRGYFCLSAPDGYRLTLSFSEVFNRNDNADFLIIDEGNGSKGGRFRLFPAPDFFSDRAIKAVNAIFFQVL